MGGPFTLPVLLLSLLGSGSEATPANSPTRLPLLTTVAAIRQLSPAEAGRGYPVHIRGVITFKVPSLMFVQDESGGIYVSPANTPPSTKRLPPGTLLEVEGETAFGRFSPSVRGCQGGPVQLKVLGQAALPEPLRLSLDQLADPRYQNQWIEVSGVVRHVTSQLYPDPNFEEVIVTLGSTTGRVKAVMFRSPASVKLPTELIGAGVRVCGVFNAIFNEKGQFLGMWLANSSLDDFRVEKASPGGPLELPLRPIASLMQFDAQHGISQRIRVRGTVTHVVAGRGMYVQAEDGGLWVGTVEPPRAQPGDEVDVAGFLAPGDWNPILEDAVYETCGTSPLPEPLAVTTQSALSGDYDCRRVVMEGLLLQASLDPQQPTLVLRSGDMIFLARLADAADFSALATAAENSSLRLEGICLNMRGEDLLKYSPPGLQELPRPAAFHLLVASPADVTIVRKPSWWTMRRVLVVLGQFSLRPWRHFRGSSCCATALPSRRKSFAANWPGSPYTKNGDGSPASCTTRWSRPWPASRCNCTRSARNCPRLRTTARQVLDVARSLLEYSRAEARRSIADLRASLLDDGDLATALRTVAAQAGSESTTAVEVVVEGQPRRLPGKIETHLLRIAQEALGNALKHGHPSRVRFWISFSDEGVELHVEDDGVGFDVDQAMTLGAGHFGLLGMRERAEKIHGSFKVQSAPGEGTTVEVAADDRLLEGDPP